MMTDGEIAQRYLERGLPEAAYIWASRSNEHTSVRYSVLGTAILQCFGVARSDDAIKAYTKAIKLTPTDFSAKLLRGSAYMMKAEDLIFDYIGDPKTGASHKSPEVREMIENAIDCARKDFFSIFKFSKSSDYRSRVAKRSGELHFLESKLGEY